MIMIRKNIKRLEGLTKEAGRLMGKGLVLEELDEDNCRITCGSAVIVEPKPNPLMTAYMEGLVYGMKLGSDADSIMYR